MIPDLSFFVVEKYWLSSCDIELNKMYMPDIIICDIWIRNFMMEINCQGFFSIDTNSEASYQ